MFKNFFKKQKLVFKISDEVSQLTLAEALAGRAGTVCLGTQGVHLWSVNDKDVPLDKEIVFDFRRRPMTKKTEEIFKKACQGRFMTAKVCLVSEYDRERVAKLHKFFNYILIPDEDGRLKNNYKNLGKGILSYIVI